MGGHLCLITFRLNLASVLLTSAAPVGLMHRMIRNFPFDSPGGTAITCHCPKQVTGPTMQLLASSYTHPPWSYQGQIWYAWVEPWAVLMWQISFESAYPVAFGRQKPGQEAAILTNLLRFGGPCAQFPCRSRPNMACESRPIVSFSMPNFAGIVESVDA